MKFSPKQIAAAKLLGQGKSQTEVAKAIGVNRRTVVRWLERHEFKQLCYGLIGGSTPTPKPPETPKPAINQQNPNRVSTEDLGNLAFLAVGCVSNILDDPDARASDRLKAAQLAGDWSGLGSQASKVEDLELLQELVSRKWLPSETVDRIYTEFQDFNEKVRAIVGGDTEESEIFEVAIEDELELELIEMEE
jgi:transposase-like protein